MDLIIMMRRPGSGACTGAYRLASTGRALHGNTEQVRALKPFGVWGSIIQPQCRASNFLIGAHPPPSLNKIGCPRENGRWSDREGARNLRRTRGAADAGLRRWPAICRTFGPAAICLLYQTLVTAPGPEAVQLGPGSADISNPARGAGGDRDPFSHTTDHTPLAEGTLLIGRGTGSTLRARAECIRTPPPIHWGAR